MIHSGCDDPGLWDLPYRAWRRRFFAAVSALHNRCDAVLLSAAIALSKRRSAGVMYPFADGTEKIRLCKSEKRSLLIMEHTVDEIKEMIGSDSDMAPKNKLNAL